MTENVIHNPVLLEETIENLNLSNDGVFVDATLGMGGYTEKILNLSKCNLVSIDRDPYAIEKAKPLVERFGLRLKIVNIKQR